MAEPLDEWVPVSERKPRDQWVPVSELQPPATEPAPAAAKPFYEPILQAFGHGFSEGWGPERMGISDENIKHLQQYGLIRKDASTFEPFKAFNELLFDQAVRVGEGLIRGGTGLYRSAQAGGVAIGELLGQKSLAKDVVSMPDMLFGSPGMLSAPKPWVKPTPFKPFEYTPVEQQPIMPRSRAALTGDPLIDAVLAHPEVRNVIDNAVVDRSHTIPYEAGGSLPLENPTTYLDKHVPETFTVRRLSDPNKTVTFDTARPTTVHENIEEWVMEKAIAAGVDPQTAYRVAHFEFAERAEQAWYEAHDIDPAAAEAEWQKIQPGIQHEIAKETPPDLYRKEYPGADVTKARHEEVFEAPPTPEEIAQVRDIIERVLRGEEVRPPKEPVPPGEPAKPPAAPDLAQAQEIGVIGPEAPAPPVGETTAAAAQRSIPARAADRSEKITHTPAGEPIDSWEARFKEWVRRLKSPEDIKPFILEAARENNNFEAARAGEVNPAHVEVVAEAAGMDPTTIDVGGLSTRFNSPDKIRILKQTLDQVTTDFKDAAAKVREDASEANIQAMLEAEIRRDYVLEYALGLRAEWGRAGHALRDLLAPEEKVTAAVGKPAAEAKPKAAAPKEATSVGKAARDVAAKIDKGEKLEIEKLINAAIDLVDAKPKLEEEAKVTKQPMAPELKELIKTAGAVVNLMDIREPQPPGVPTVRPLRQLIKESDKAPTSPLSKFNRLVSDAERLASGMAKEGRTPTAREALPPELAELVERAKNITEHFGGAGLNRKIQELLDKKGRTVEDMQEIARGMEGLNNAQAARVLSEMRGKTPGVIYWTWVNGLISGLLTHTKYVGGNALMLMTERGITTPLAGIIGKAKQVTGLGAEVDRVFFGETIAGIAGTISAVPEAFIATGKSIYSGQRYILKSELELHNRAIARGEKPPADLVKSVNQVFGTGRPAVFQKSDVWGRLKEQDWRGAGKDVAGRVIGAPGDMAMGIHTFFKIIGDRAGIESRAYRKAIQEVPEAWTSGEAEGRFWDRFHYHRMNPTEEAMIGSRAEAYKGTFMQELGPKGRQWQQLTKHGPLSPVLKWVFPFSHIPVNLVKAGYEHMPVVPLADATMRADILGKNGGIAQDKAIARMVVGSAIMGFLFNKAMNGQATGDLPRDAKERDSWNLQNKQPNSILLNGYWVSFNKVGPIGTLANLSANLAQVIPHLTHGDDEQMTKATWELAHAAARMVIDEVGFLSIFMLFEAINDDKKAAGWMASQAASLVPFSSLLGQTASGGLPGAGGLGGDPYMREVKSFTDGVKYKIPGLRETLLPKRSFLGEPVPNPQYGNIIKQKPAASDPVALEMDRLAVHPAPPNKVVGGVTLPPQIYDQYQVRAGVYVRRSLEGLIKQPGWYNLPSFVREEMFRAAIKQSHEIAAAQLQIQYYGSPQDIVKKGMENRLKHIQGEKITPAMKKVPDIPALQ